MKLITAIIRPEKLDELVSALTDYGVRGVTVTDVRGFGQQYGRLIGAASTVTGPGGGRVVVLLHKARLDLVVLDDDAETIVEAIAKHTGTETIGDGKIVSLRKSCDVTVGVSGGLWPRHAGAGV
jgi:nitrogen regulatory protein PII